MAKWTGAGIELCGRRDNQVKIRGFRVEPEEIERCLRDSQLYRQVAVVIDSQRRILAFLAQPQEDQPGAAREALKAHAIAVPAGLHAAHRMDRTGEHAVRQQRQGRPQGAAGAARQHHRKPPAALARQCR